MSPLALVAFLAAVVGVLVVGPRMARTADRLGEVTRLGGALFGLVFLSLATDLPELALTPTAVVTGSPHIGIGSLLGSAAAQLTLIAGVDIALRRGTLYRNIPVQTGLAQSALMLAVLAVPLIAVAGTPTLGRFSLATVLLPVAYLGVLGATTKIGRPIAPPIEDEDDPDRSTESADGSSPSARALWLRFGGFALVLTAAGIALEWSTERIGHAIGLGETAAGALLAGVATSLPELVTAVAATRAGALELAVGDVVGSSALDVMLLAYADVFYGEGSIFELLGPGDITLLGMSLALTALLVLGLARGESAHPRRVGSLSYVMIAVYIGGAALLVGADR